MERLKPPDFFALSFSCLSFNFESVFEKCINADFWINTGMANSINDILSIDKRYVNFSALKNKNIYNNNNRLNKAGGNDFWEIGVIYPNIILKDLIKIFHPQVLPDYNLYFYKKLE